MVLDPADRTGRATERVTAQVERIRAACEQVAVVMTEVGTSPRRTAWWTGSRLASTVRAFPGPGGDDATGPSQPAERFALAGDRFLAEMRR